MNSSGKRTLVVAVILGVIAVAVIAIVLRPKPTASAGPPPEVMVVPVVQKDVALYSEWIGTLDGLVNANVKAQVTGYLLQQDYQEGAYVEKGQLLFQIDPPDRPPGAHRVHAVFDLLPWFDPDEPQ